MKSKFQLLTLIVSIFFLSFFSYGQGCSDAGFCTMGAMRPDQNYNKKAKFKLRSLELNFYRGTTTLSPKITIATADINFGISEKLSFQVKVPYQMVKGSLGKTSGLADLSLSATRNVYSTHSFDINVTLGAKIPTNNSNLTAADTVFAEQDVRPLPMYYQVSLGSFDAIAGASLISRNWLFAFGIQKALTRNKNKFRHEDWPDYPDPDYLESNQIATNLKRGTDLMLRIERNFRFSKYNFSVGLLPIYRISKDEILDTELNRRVKLNGTTGLAMSGLVSAGYNITVNSSVKLILGWKITQRDVNPDGLTRNSVSSISYITRF